MLELCHCYLDHLNMKDNCMLQNMVSGTNLGKFSCLMSFLFCKACIEGIQHTRVAFPNKGEQQMTKPLKIVHSNICGSMRTTSMGSARYFITLLINFQGRYGCMR